MKRPPAGISGGRFSVETGAGLWKTPIEIRERPEYNRARKGGKGVYLLLGSRGGEGRAEARALLALALEEGFGLRQMPEIARGERGKPYFPSHPQIHFNLSHSGPLALCAVGEEPVGVDIEVLRPRSPRLPQRALTPEELVWYDARGRRWEDFYTLWTRKESLVKYTGAGLYDPRQVQPPLPEEEGGEPLVRSWAGEDWRAALCGRGPLPASIRWVPSADEGQHARETL